MTSRGMRRAQDRRAAKQARRGEVRSRSVAAGTAGVIGVTTLGGALLAAPAEAATPAIQVTNLNDAGAGSLRAALAQADNQAGHDTITFSGVSGTIHLTSGELRSDGDVTVTGPGSGALTIDAGGQSRDLNIYAGYYSDDAAPVVISGLTFTGGTAKEWVEEYLYGGETYPAHWSYGAGGGLQVGASSVSLDDVVVEGNVAGTGGGASLWGDSVSVSDSTFSDNAAGAEGRSWYSGGGLYAYGRSSVSLTGVDFDGNTSTGHGGGVYASGDTVSISGVRSTGNTTVGSGGGIEAASDHLSLVGSVVSGNHAEDAGGVLLSGLYHYSSSAPADEGAVVSHVQVTGNTAAHTAGIQISSRAPVSIDTATIAGNVSEGSVGGLAVDRAAHAMVTSSTIAGNTGTGARFTASSELRNSILADNASDGGGHTDLVTYGYYGDATVALDYTLVESVGAATYEEATAGSNLIGVDPQLGSLADNGGGVLSAAPAAGSPVVDKGKSYGISPDATGRPRPVDNASIGNAADGADMGAVELQTGTKPPAAVVPGAPTGVLALPDDRSALLSWTAPASSGGSSITGYRIEAKPAAAADTAWATVLTVGPAATSVAVTGLTNGTAYSFRVAAVNAVGASAASAVSTVTPASQTSPTPPLGIGASAADGALVVSWAEPRSDGHSDITGYKVQVRPGAGGAWTTVNAGATSSAATVSGLTNGTAYDVQVIASNALGDSLPSQVVRATPTAPAAGVTVPTAPSVFTYVDEDLTSLGVQWSQPDDGGSEILSYQVRYRPTGGAWVDGPTVPADGFWTYTELSGLTAGASYEVEVRATNAKGTSPAGVRTVTMLSAPSQPNNVGVAPGNGKALVVWSAPSSTGGVPVTGYTVHYRVHSDDEDYYNPTEYTTLHVDSPTATSAEITGLTNGTTYDVYVTATNSIGEGNGSGRRTVTPSAAAPAPTAPSPATLTSVEGYDGELDIYWTSSSDTGGLPVTYQVQTSPHGTNTWTTIGTTGSPRYYWYEAVNGTTYDVRIIASNGIGAASPSNVISATAGDGAGVPGPVTLSPLSAGNGSLTASWSPQGDGGSAITGYQVEYKLHSAATWTTFPTTGTGTVATITGLTNGSLYDVRVSAVNDLGTGPASTVQSGTPAAVVTAPAAPTLGTLTPGNGTIAVGWTAPASNGGAAISAYKLEYKLHSAAAWATFPTSGTGTAATITGLTNGSSYDVRVSAVNSAGTGTASATKSATPIASPGQPTLGTVAPGDAALAVSWTAPASDGGSAITGYKVEYKLHSATAWTTFPTSGTGTTATITGLTNGSSYDVRVSAVNAAGTGTPSASKSGTPVTVPGAPALTAATPGNGSVGVAWTAPASDGGSAITGYKVQVKPTSGSTWTTSATTAAGATSVSLTALTNGTSYDVRVVATSAVGDGTPSTTRSVTPLASLPQAPTQVTATPGNGSLLVTWTAPVDDGGSAIIGYQVQVKPTSGTTWATTSAAADATSATVLSLTNGTSYDVRVIATNGSGDSSPSAVSSATPVTVPGAPAVVRATPGNAAVTLAWSAPASTGGTPVTGYLVQYRAAATAAWSNGPSLGASARSATVTGLGNGVVYTFQVLALNAVGSSLPSGPVSAVPMAPVVPLPGLATPRISGQLKAGKKVTALVPAAVTGATYSFQWTFTPKKKGKKKPVAKVVGQGRTLKLKRTWKGGKVTLTITASKPGVPSVKAAVTKTVK